MKVTWAGFSLISGVLACGIYSTSVNAQVIPDGTLKTTVLENGNNFTITEGNRVGNNLFHSFSQFSIPSKGSAFFNNASDIQNIFSRVTGGSVSNIDGLIKANGSANLFLLNPSGMIFGQNASLNIGGSFVGTTANSIKFADGIEFSAVNPTGTPLLTMSVPIGLQMGTNSGNIQLQGKGHQLTGGGFTPVIRDNNQSTLEVNSGQAIALVGQNVTLSGGVLTAENGRVEVGAVKAGTVNINSTSSDFQLDYTNIESFGDIQLVNQSLLDASGLTSRGIQLQGNNISLKDGSAALIQTVGSQEPNIISVDAKGVLDLSGDVRIAPDLGIVTGVISSRLMTENLGLGKGADIDIYAGDLHLNDGGFVLGRTYGFDSGGNINVNVARDIQINRVAQLNPVLNSGVLTTNFSPKKSGNVNITASNIKITDGGLINTTNFAQGDSGNVNLNVAGTIEVKGVESRNLSPSNIGSTVFGKGNGGSLNLNTSRLIVENGASVTTSTFSSGAGDKITINASKSIEVRGRSPNGERPSSITASAPIFPITFRQTFRLPDLPTGNASSLTINTPTLLIDNGARVAVNNEGSGNGGILNINANSLRLDNKGQIIANTASGEGGNINLNLKSDLILRNNSLISTEAKGTRNGGNITINAPIILGLENSDMIANAFKGKGGNIEIRTQDIIGLEFRDTLTPTKDLTNDITASSEFNVNGTIRINNVGVDPNSGLIELPENVTDPSQQIASGCSTNQGSSFVATGKGGIPQNPSLDVRSDTSAGLYSLRTWSDIRDISAFRTTQSVQAQIPKLPETLVQATAWYRNAQGKIELVVDKSSNQVQQLTCAAISQN
ncbi:filamentous hemagglutinin N-terminal domain-containing protein [Calothrix sp. PCC 6303]|uniref:two-partner secretion domain-containing protein n=1 Tax=Calothrix sp. PCC 6303 TaxID=1170562 RepID=UPI0002A04914|nr:S-layer family protein [Calothrix sp. PCC 6303]AFZ02489.1 filamentous hemagglutinin family outer membrane protein [Calothrix sp. PCC 6303]